MYVRQGPVLEWHLSKDLRSWGHKTVQLYEEKVIQGTSTQPLRQKCAWCAQGAARRPGHTLEAKRCYRSWALKATVKSVVSILREKRSHLLFWLLSIKSIRHPAFIYANFLNFVSNCGDLQYRSYNEHKDSWNCNSEIWLVDSSPDLQEKFSVLSNL